MAPEKREKVDAGDETYLTEDLPFRHMPDFRSIFKAGKLYSLTPTQAQVIEILTEAWNNKTPEVGQGYIIERVAGATTIRSVKRFFRGNEEAYYALIEQGKRKGTLRLKE